MSTRLAHLFFLVDQHDEDERRAVEESAEFAAWLTDYAQAWGSFLDTPESFGPAVLQSFLENAPDYTVGDRHRAHPGLTRVSGGGPTGAGGRASGRAGPAARR